MGCNLFMNLLPQFAFLQKEVTLIGFVACNGDFGLWAPHIIQKGLTFLFREGSFFHPLFIIIFVYTSWVSSSSCFSSWCWWWWWWWSMRLLLRVKRFGKSWSCWNLDLLVFLSKKVSIFYFIFYSSGITMILSPSCVSMNLRTLSFLVFGLALFQ